MQKQKMKKKLQILYIQYSVNMCIFRKQKTTKKNLCIFILVFCSTYSAILIANFQIEINFVLKKKISFRYNKKRKFKGNPQSHKHVRIYRRDAQRRSGPEQKSAQQTEKARQKEEADRQEFSKDRSWLHVHWSFAARFLRRRNQELFRAVRQNNQSETGSLQVDGQP